MNVCPTCETLVYLASGAKDYASNKNVYAELVNRFSIYPKLIYNLVFIAKAKLEIVGSRLYIRKKQDIFYIDFNLDDVKLFHNNYCQTARDNNFTDNVGGFHEHSLINTEPSERFKEAVKQVTKYKYEEAKKVHEKKRKRAGQELLLTNSITSTGDLNPKARSKLKKLSKNRELFVCLHENPYLL